ncbi:siderophore-interacting protein [Acetobacter ascendens]|uniref:Ferric-chelate reductase (NADPH) n=1 Tax=Acetobacter ascendens TaxID=481146 RepID=A0A1Y0V4Q8_9PROT|nr:siderophore-interacting protein [Acetobacter ascendens]ARW11393.1 Ferric-chelate reductase (NADPH) [Acetobacter ascendens]RCL05586.1 NADPH-dependent ferric siderophore reductase [Acetobacter pasteurianus]GCD75210.1 siderophore-interacting iron utilization protein [Acetobacter pasteurianus NBRC 3299]
MIPQNAFSDASNAPEIQRVRHELHRRSLEVVKVERLTPHMIRVTLAGPDLAGFVSASPDDHIKIFIPGLDGAPVRRDYTPRKYDSEAGTLVLDFVDHKGGPAAAWARAAKVGDYLDIGGPKGSQVISGNIAHWLLIGDETALPAIGRRVEELSAPSHVTTLVAVSGQEDEQMFKTSARHTAYWVHRPLDKANDAQSIVSVLSDLDIPERTFIWVGAEARVAKTVRQYLLEKRGIAAQWVKASGYWVKGQADASVKNVGV